MSCFTIVFFLFSILSLRFWVSFLILSSSIATVFKFCEIHTAESTYVLLATFSSSVSLLSRFFLRSLSVAWTFLRLPFFTYSYSILTSISRNFVSFCSSSFLNESFLEFCDSNCLRRWFDSLSASVIFLFYFCLMLTVSFCLANEFLLESSPWRNKLSTWSLCIL